MNFFSNLGLWILILSILVFIIAAGDFGTYFHNFKKFSLALKIIGGIIFLIALIKCILVFFTEYKFKSKILLGIETVFIIFSIVKLIIIIVYTICDYQHKNNITSDFCGNFSAT